jgi:hypothetical protein
MFDPEARLDTKPTQLVKVRIRLEISAQTPRCSTIRPTVLHKPANVL